MMLWEVNTALRERNNTEFVKSSYYVESVKLGNFAVGKKFLR
jgi:hypothetical protein